MYIGIDLGTSGVKLFCSTSRVSGCCANGKADRFAPASTLVGTRPEQWWQATDRAMKALGVQHSLQDVKALGIAGQMHGATLLDAQQRVLRPAILWNDGRCAQSALCWKREFRNRG